MKRVLFTSLGRKRRRAGVPVLPRRVRRTMQDDSANLLDRWRTGDEDAAEDLFQRYSERLISLVRAHLSEKFAARLDAEDVVQSAFRSFFRGSREGRYLLAHSGDLWRLLVAIAQHKLQHQAHKHTAAKRSVARESATVHSGAHAGKGDASVPSPNDALSVAEAIESICARLRPIEQRMFELRLEAYTLDEIALDTQRSQRTVRRVMDRIKTMVREW